jgi:Fur family peroxide stress response transcriptional regulator
VSRRSNQRETILKVVINTRSHPGANWVYDQVRQEIPNISLGTVYRNLKSLAETGKIHQIDFPGSCSRFDGNIANHCHFRCEQCGVIFDLEEEVDHSIEADVAKRTGFKVKGHHLELFGLCSRCQ